MAINPPLLPSSSADRLPVQQPIPASEKPLSLVGAR
jgi:hypothetical protein